MIFLVISRFKINLNYFFLHFFLNNEYILYFYLNYNVIIMVNQYIFKIDEYHYKLN